MNKSQSQKVSLDRASLRVGSSVWILIFCADIKSCLGQVSRNSRERA